MDLQTFVAESLKEIIAAVKEAGAYAVTEGAEINPAQDSWDDHVQRFDGLTGRAVSDVAFDIAVVAQEDKKTKGGIGVVVGTLALGSQGESGALSQSTSRVKLSVPVVLPSTRLPKLTQG